MTEEGEEKNEEGEGEEDAVTGRVYIHLRSDSMSGKRQYCSYLVGVSSYHFV